MNQQKNDGLNRSLSLNQFEDPELYHTMKKVVKESKEKYIHEEKKDEFDKLEGDDDKGSLIKSLSTSTKRKFLYQKLDEEFKDIFNKGNSNINSCRRCLIYLIVVVGVLNCLAWEIDCLFLNICYGEEIEMDKWISHSLFPSIILSIIILYFLSGTITYLKKSALIFCAIIYFLLSIYLFIIGVISLYNGINNKMSKALKDLTFYEKKYYENYRSKNDGEWSLKYHYRYKMIVSGGINLFLSLMGAVVFIFTICFNSLLSQTTYDWRPPLRSHVRIQRITKAIDLYTQNNESFVNLFKAENPNYQIDEDNKNINRFEGIKNEMEESLKKDKLSNSSGKKLKKNIIDDNESEDLPKVSPKKRKLRFNNNDDNKENEDKKEDKKENNLIEENSENHKKDNENKNEEKKENNNEIKEDKKSNNSNKNENENHLSSSGPLINKEKK